MSERADITHAIRQQALALQPDHHAARHNLELVKERLRERVA
jgi:hypothetical protein